jgi:formylglycine-generating enzyme required for sulfatase activity
MNNPQTCPICKLGLNEEAEQCPRCGWDLTDTIGPLEAVGAELQARAAEARRRWDERREEELARREEELKRREEEIRQEKEKTRQQEEAHARHEEELKRREEEIGQEKERTRQQEEAHARRAEELKRRAEEIGQEKEKTRQQEEAQARRAEELKRREEEIRQEKEKTRQQEEAQARRAEEMSRPRQAPAPKAIAAAPKTCANSLGMEFVLIPAGSFLMGSPDSDRKARDNEKPQHKVTISQPFYLGKYEVTQSQWEAVMGSNPSDFSGRSNPVENVSWEDVQGFIKKLNQKEGGNKYRLPTEAEWEYAARAGTTSIYSFGDDAGALGRYAWCWGNSGWSTHPVGQKEPNPWGLCDMHGNVYEWVQDWYGKNYYAESPGIDPRGPSSGSYRVFRGGCWINLARNCRSAARDEVPPGHSSGGHGFRLAFSPGQ